MSNARILIFCTATLLASLGLSIGLTPLASVSPDTLQQAAIPQPLDAFDQPIRVGHRHGEMTVTQLMEYYIEHPPKAVAGVPSTAAAPVQFGGC
ncbi:hypothetical protein [Acidihalobacter prosperus]|uniref:Uncharacterized protein n=1 Tax=Acidihalobacter prosperus TaxID=160660 RepID=A0A1A6C7F6_9GAMM|nr:hypothetical protein [Acidihalobacter prosperus]OBS10496.1 hypothetical protein Thpro_020212 [Acidihalobacter prosperus]